MTTRSIVPNGDGEGSLGTASLKWGKVYSSAPASGENSGQVPTTAWVQTLVAKAVADATAAIEKQAKLDAHPVGSYYFSDKSTSPADLFGGTWEALPAGYTLIAQGSGTDDFGSFNYVAGTKYGERMHKLTVEELPSHSHKIYSGYNTSGEHQLASSDGYRFQKWGDGNRGWHDGQLGTSNVGGTKAHQNVQPSIAVYGWRRTA